MKHLLLTTIAAVLVVGCGPTNPPDRAAAQLLLGLKPSEMKIWEAAGNGNIEAVQYHLNKGVDINAKDYKGWTALHR